MESLDNKDKSVPIDADDFSLRLRFGGLPASPDQIDQDSTGEDDSPIVVYKAISFGNKASIEIGFSESETIPKNETNNV